MNDLKRGVVFIWKDEPYIVIDTKHTHMGRGGSSVAAKIRNLKNGNVLSETFKSSDSFEEADIEKKKIVFLYGYRGKYVFHPPGKPEERFEISDEVLQKKAQYLKPNTEVEALFFEDEIIDITLPIKMDFKVREAPPGIKGNTAQGGTKTVTLENGLKIQAPLFINEGDVVRVNTETGAYSERVEKKTG